MTVTQPDLFDADAVDTDSAVPTSYRDRLVEQIARDMAVLREKPDCWHPSRAFYEERIAAYREEVQKQVMS